MFIIDPIHLCYNKFAGITYSHLTDDSIIYIFKKGLIQFNVIENY